MTMMVGFVASPAFLGTAGCRNIRNQWARRQSDCLDIEFSVDKYRCSDGVFQQPTRLRGNARQKSLISSRVYRHERGRP